MENREDGVAEKREYLLKKIERAVEANEMALQRYLRRMVVKRNRTSLMMNSFMHNIVDIENSV